MKAPCWNCSDWEENFPECVKDCCRFRSFAEKIISFKKGSPCQKNMCGMPGANEDKSKCPKGCPLPKLYDIYLNSLDKNSSRSNFNNEPWHQRGGLGNPLPRIEQGSL